MSQISFVIEKKTNKQGLAQVRLRVTNRCTRAFIVTGVFVEPKYFIDGSLYDPIHRKAYMSVEKREQLLRFVKQYDQWFVEQNPQEVKLMTAQEIKECVWGQAQVQARMQDVPKRQKRMPNDMNDFMVFFGQYGDSRQAEKTRKIYYYAWNVLQDYCKSCGMQTLYFSDIDYKRLMDFGVWLRATGKGESTRHGIESYVRAAYKEAQKMHLVDRSNDPYFDYSIAPVPQKDIECLTIEQMRALYAIDLSETSGLCRARDCALISFYLCGANLMDIYHLPPMSGEVVFVRHKVEQRNQREQHIRIEPELQVLLDKYHGKTHLLHFAESTPNYETFQSRMNKLLLGVSARLGFKVTMAMVRRSWASIAASLDIPDRVIDKSLGHVDSSVKDRHYEQYDWSRTERANRAVIDAVMGA